MGNTSTTRKCEETTPTDSVDGRSFSVQGLGAYSHDLWVSSIVYFGHPCDKIVSGSEDKRIFIVSSLDYKVLKVIKDFGSKIKDVEKWSDTEFLVCSHFSVRSYSIEEPFEMKKNLSCLGKKHLPVRMIKIDSNCFLCQCRHAFCVISYGNDEIMKILKCVRNAGYSSLSRAHEETLFCSRDMGDDNYGIMMVDLKKDKIIHEIPSAETFILSIDSYVNPEGEEVIIYCGRGNDPNRGGSSIFIYNVTRSLKQEKKSSLKTIFIERPGEPIYDLVSVLCIEKDYFCVGDGESTIFVSGSSVSERICSKDNVRINTIVFGRQQDKSVGKEIICGCSDGSVKIMLLKQHGGGNGLNDTIK